MAAVGWPAAPQATNSGTCAALVVDVCMICRTRLANMSKNIVADFGFYGLNGFTLDHFEGRSGARPRKNIRTKMFCRSCSHSARNAKMLTYFYSQCRTCPHPLVSRSPRCLKPFNIKRLGSVTGAFYADDFIIIIIIIIKNSTMNHSKPQAPNNHISFSVSSASTFEYRPSNY